MTDGIIGIVMLLAGAVSVFSQAPPAKEEPGVIIVYVLTIYVVGLGNSARDPRCTPDLVPSAVMESEL